MITYRKLWDTMKEKGVTQYALITFYHISPGQITRLKRNESVSTHTIDMFCRILSCNISDIMEYIPEEPEINATEQTVVAAEATKDEAVAQAVRSSTIECRCIEER